MHVPEARCEATGALGGGLRQIGEGEVRSMVAFLLEKEREAGRA